MCFPFFGYAQQGLLAEYYDGHAFDRFVSKEYVKNIEEYWDEKPLVEGIDPHNCSIRWTGQLVPARSETYIFTALVDDGIRVWIDGDLIIDQWTLNDLGNFSGKKAMVKGQAYDLRVEYFNALNEGEIKLMWDIEKPSDDQSWYEYFMGVEYDYQLIPSELFRRPVEIVEIPDAVPPPPPPVVNKDKKVSTPPIVQKPIEEKPAPPPAIPQKVMTQAKAEKYIPKDVQFVISEAEVLPSSFDELNTFAKFMKENPHVHVTIEGHTDVVGDKEKNQELSENRAKKIASYLRERGIQGKRIITVGYGGSRPLKRPAKGEYYPPNRRVVFILSGLQD